MNFTETFIDALQRGKEHAHQNKLREWEDEDRGIHKDLLAHQLKQLKIQDRIQARNAAVANLEQLQGTPEEQFGQKPFDLSNPDFSGGIPSRASGGGPDVPTVDIPGIDELGIPGVKAKPQTLEQVLAAQLAELKQKAMWTAHNTPRGGQTVIPGLADKDNPDGVVAKGDPILRPYTNRDAAGTETTEYLSDEEIAKRGPAKKFRLPQRASSGGGNGITRATDAEVDDWVAGVVSGKTPASTMPNATSDLGVRLLSRLKKTGFDATRAVQDEKAFGKYLSTLNGQEQQGILQASGAASDALDVLEQVVTAQGDGAKMPGTKPYQDLQAAVNAVVQQLALLKSGGSSSNDKALAMAEKELSTGWTGSGILPKIKRLRTSLGYRVGAINKSFMSSDDVTKKPTAAGGGKDPLGIR